VDYFIGPPSVHSQQVHRTDLYEVPILRMYGVTEAGARRRRPAPARLGALPLPRVPMRARLRPAAWLERRLVWCWRRC